MTAQETTIVLTQATMPSGRGKGGKTNKILTDGTLFYCGGLDDGTPCPTGYKAERFGQVMSHRSGRHGQVKVEHKANADMARNLRHLRGRAAAMLTEIERLSAEVAEPTVVKADPSANGKVDSSWKDRAKAAEKELAAIRRTIGRLAG